MLVEQFIRLHFKVCLEKSIFNSKTGFISRKIDILQIIRVNEIHYVATINEESSTNRNESFEYIPDTFRNETVRESGELAIFFNLITTFLLILVVVLQIITIIYRKNPSIKASSPILLHMSYLGVYLVLIGTYFWSFHVAAVRVDSRHYFCSLLWIWCLPLGFTLAFCSVAVRTWRVYRISSTTSIQGHSFRLPSLVGTVMVCIDDRFDHFVDLDYCRSVHYSRDCSSRKYQRWPHNRYI